jgi:hypothetical protein
MYVFTVGPNLLWDPILHAKEYLTCQIKTKFKSSLFLHYIEKIFTYSYICQYFLLEHLPTTH